MSDGSDADADFRFLCCCNFHKYCCLLFVVGAALCCKINLVEQLVVTIQLLFPYLLAPTDDVEWRNIFFSPFVVSCDGG